MCGLKQRLVKHGLKMDFVTSRRDVWIETTDPKEIWKNEIGHIP